MECKRIIISFGVIFMSVRGSPAAGLGSGMEIEKQHAVHVHLVQTALDRSAFYKAMEENNKALVNAELEELKTAPESLKPAFMGTMLMKRASFSGSPSSKLHYFKEGHILLEGAIKKNPDNVEYRFMRLMIQEHAPGVLGYKENIENDCEYIRKYYKSLPVEVQHAIGDYNKKSKVLKLDVS